MKKIAVACYEAKLPHFFVLTGLGHSIPTWVLLAWWAFVLLLVGAFVIAKVWWRKDMFK